MDDMVERVARAIAFASLADDPIAMSAADTPEGMYLDPKFMDQARAAIEAMVEPTVPMLASGWQQLRRQHLPRLGPGDGLTEAYNAMVAAAVIPVSHPANVEAEP